VLSEGCCFYIFRQDVIIVRKTSDIPPPPFAESSPLSTRAVSTLQFVVAAVVCCTLLGVIWVHAGKCCRPHFTGCVYIFCTSSVSSGSNPLILTYRGDSNCTTYFADCLTALKLGKTTCHRSLHCDSTHLFSVHICVVQVTWLRSVVFDRLVNGRFTVVADRVGSILRRVVTDRACSC
jgi:hypothetical protein